MTRLSKDNILGSHRFAKILIANRGEIACRIMRTARRLGIYTVAVYSEADRHAAHVDMADEAWEIGPAPVKDSYLDIDAIIEVARKAEVDAIHPGYGFLSEKSNFAEACSAAGFVFIGPPATAIKAMGDKAEAKRIMAAAGVPLIPGYHEEDQSDDAIKVAAKDIGYPILIKAAAGGGGKGMRIVEQESDLLSAITSARREAVSAFGDDRIIVEKFLRNPRHIEVQVFADTQGNIVHLYDRDCSIQRRYQKVIEEAPAPELPDTIRKAMYKTAIEAAKAINYISAGTIEFIYADGHFYFMEMNTRLQVEHPVTEMITRIDLVEWQIDVAAGLPLPFRQEDITAHGHAIEARLYAEDPQNDFLPSTGKIYHLQMPEQSGDLWVDSGIRQGDEVTVYYDPMIAKVISWSEDRSRTIDQLREALLSIEIAGPITNAGFLATVLDHPAFRLGEITTEFITNHKKELLANKVTPLAIWVIAAIARADSLISHYYAIDDRSDNSLWGSYSGWRLNETPAPICFSFKDQNHEIILFVTLLGRNFSLMINQEHIAGFYTRQGDTFYITYGSLRVEGRVILHQQSLTIFYQGQTYRLIAINRDEIDPHHHIGMGATLTAVMPGRVLSISVVVGEKIKKGQVLAIMEAMKMEHKILAPFDGIVTEVLCRPGDIMAEGTRLVVLDEKAPDAITH
ncbi:MAG: acetyl-CoA carboxylase biotin carboxylase subunit [Alphaproteobacteria bacterium]